MIYLDGMQDKLQDKFNMMYGGRERERESKSTITNNTR